MTAYAGTVADGDDATLRANARLIAAAPEMYEALQFIAKELAQHTDNGLRNNPVTYAINRARAALAKAEGHAP